jgi:hypothetical protein
MRSIGKHPGSPPVDALMTYSRHLLKGAETDQMDRRLIRVEFPPAQAGIAAALRRAFQAAPLHADVADRDIDELLARLN